MVLRVPVVLCPCAARLLSRVPAVLGISLLGAYVAERSGSR